MTMEDEIRNLLNEVLLFNEGEGVHYGNDESFLKRNLIDSTTIMEIVLLIEANFGIEIQDNEIIPDNFDSVCKIATYLRLKIGQADILSHDDDTALFSLADLQE